MSIDNIDKDDSDGEISEDEDSFMELNPIWATETAGLKNIKCTGENKVLFPIPGNALAIAYFNLEFDTVFLKNIVRETNRNTLDIF